MCARDGHTVEIGKGMENRTPVEGFGDPRFTTKLCPCDGLEGRSIVNRPARGGPMSYRS